MSQGQALKSSYVNELAVSSQKGNKSAYKILLNESYSIIRSYVNKKASYLNATEDITQETLMAVHSSLHTYLPDLDYRFWVLGIARKKIADAARKMLRRGKLEIMSHSILDFQPDLANSHVNDEREDLLLTLMKELPEKYAEPLHMSKIEGLSLKEVASRLALTESAVKTRCSRAMIMLKKKLERYLKKELF